MTRRPAIPDPGPLWTMDELCDRAEAVLAAQGVASESGRVRALPDERTLRYYTTLGLLARPTTLRGRTAFYGRAHLCQVVAIKRLQARGHSLAQIQERLAGLTSREVETLAQPPPAEPLESPTSSRLFWAEPAEGKDEPPAEPRSGTWLELGPETFLMLTGPSPRTREDRMALLKAATPLLEELHRQGLLSPPTH